MQLIFQLLWASLLFLGLTACASQEPTATSAPVALTTHTAVPATPTPTPPTATLPPTAVSTETITPSPSPTPTSKPTNLPTSAATPTPTATPSPDPRQLGFQPVDFASFPIQALWLAPNGRLWVHSDSGLWERTDEDVFRQRTRTLDVQILGADGDGRVWALFDGGHTIGVHLSGTDWASFGAEAGWEPAIDLEFGQGILTDRLGQVWLALGRAGLRRFNPTSGRWQTLHAADVGFSPPISENDTFAYDPRLAFTDVVLDNFGNVWASACAVWVADEEGPLPLLLHQGQGARWFDGAAWAGSAAITDRCVQDMAVDENGRVWLVGPQNDLWTGENNFVRFDPNDGIWEYLPVPEQSELFSDRPRFARALTLDENGRIWLFVARRGGASFPPDGVYVLEAGEWRLILEMLPGMLAFGPDDTMWAWLEPGFLAASDPAGLVRYQDGVWQAQPFPWTSPVQEMALDGDGRLWFYLNGNPWTLWYTDAP